jgi:prevent-host-death family protein
MRTYPLHEARSEFSKLVDRALSGEPQHVTRHGKEAVVIVSEEQWSKCARSAPTLADLFLKHAGDEVLGERSWTNERPLGSDFTADD